MLSCIAVLLPTLAWSAPQHQLTVDLVPLDRLAQQYYEDAKRIEVYYPKQYERLEMDWERTAQSYLRQYAAAATLQDKLDVFARFYYSWNNGHHQRLLVRGLAKDQPENSLMLPVRIFGQGLKLSQARFFISALAKEMKGIPIQIGDEIIAYDGRPIGEYTLETRDEVTSESPEDHIYRLADHMAMQRQCWWGKLRCWGPGEKISLELKDAQSGERKKVQLVWEQSKMTFGPPAIGPVFPPTASSWSFETISGAYAPDYDSAPEGQHAFLGRIMKDGKKWLLIKMFMFRDLGFVQSAIKEARSPDYQGVILDFSENHGGDDSAMTFLGGVLGTSFHLELSSIRLVKEFRDRQLLREATFGDTKSSFLHPLLKDSNLNRMAPFTPFACLDKTCPLQTEYSFFVDHYDRPVIVSSQPVPNIALITGAGTVSKSDSIAALFRATKIGPILGTPAMGSSGTYYFPKDYVVPVQDHAITLTVTFTPDFSLAADCQEVQANPPTPDVLIERTFENRAYYDTLTWITAATALQTWDAKPQLGISCSNDEARRRLRKFGLILSEEVKGN